MMTELWLEVVESAKARRYIKSWLASGRLVLRRGRVYIATACGDLEIRPALVLGGCLYIRAATRHEVLAPDPA